MTALSIGEKIRQLRIKFGLTQEELAARTELSKGFISQLERDLTSPSIATLMDILEALGTNIRDFFNEDVAEKVVYGAEDVFVKEEDELGYSITWLVTNAQKNAIEPILMTIAPGAQSPTQDAHEGEEFGYVLAGRIELILGEAHYKVKKGDSFYFRPGNKHYLYNPGKTEAKILWVASPPSF